MSVMGIVKFVGASLLMVAVGTFIINRVGILKSIVYGA